MPKLRCLRCGDLVEEGEEKTVEIYGGAVEVCASCEATIRERHRKTGRFDLMRCRTCGHEKITFTEYKKRGRKKMRPETRRYRRQAQRRARGQGMAPGSLHLFEKRESKPCQ